jgi:hypothetical protein
MRISKNVVDAKTGNLAAPVAVRAAVPVPAKIVVQPVKVADGIWWLADHGNHRSILGCRAPLDR